VRAASRHFKLGALAVLALAAAMVIVFALGLRKPPVEVYHTYFDESVQGLDEGAIVKFRGVRIGKVESIRVARDRRLIDVALAIGRDRARELHLDRSAGTLRTQLVIYGITGVKLIDMDFAGPHTAAAPELTFQPPKHYIPSQPSTLGSIEEDVVSFTHRLPMLADHAVGAMDAFKMFTLDTRGLVDDARSTLSSITHLARKISHTDVSAAIEKALASVDELGKRGLDAADDLENTVRDVGEAARALRDFLEALEREPDMIVKGRAKRR
jgi:hypothetical protein